MCMSLSLHAASNTAAFNEIGYEPTSEALGMTGVSHQKGSSSVYWNPARLAADNHNEISTNFYHAYETDFMSLSGVLTIRQIPIGIRVAQAQIGGVLGSEKNSELGRVVLTGERFDYQGRGIIVATGKKLHEKILAGVGIKYLMEEAATYNATGVGGDLGLFIDAHERLKVGMNIQNIIEPEMRWNTPSGLRETVNRKVRIGTTSIWFNEKAKVHNEWVMQKRSPGYVNWGIAYHIHDILELQGGLSRNRKSLGASLAIYPLNVSFSWTIQGREFVDDYYKFGIKIRI